MQRNRIGEKTRLPRTGGPLAHLLTCDLDAMSVFPRQYEASSSDNFFRNRNFLFMHRLIVWSWFLVLVFLEINFRVMTSWDFAKLSTFLTNWWKNFLNLRKKSASWFLVIFSQRCTWIVSFIWTTLPCLNEAFGRTLHQLSVRANQ